MPMVSSVILLLCGILAPGPDQARRVDGRYYSALRCLPDMLREAGYYQVFMGAALVIIDTSTDGPDVRAALAEMTGEARPGEAPSTTPVLVIGPDDALREFDGPGAALAKPAEKRALLESARTLVAGYREGAKRKWSRRSRA